MAYTAPAKDTVHFVGGLGDQSDKHANNGGGATKTAWDAGSPSDFIGTNGGPITSDTNCTYTHATKNISKAGIGAGVTEGTLVYVSGTNITTGIYELTTRTDDNNIICSGIDSTDNNADTTCNVGGAFDTLANAADDDSATATSYNRTVYTNLVEAGLAATVYFDSGGGTRASNTWKRFIGCDSDMVKLAKGSYLQYTNSAAIGFWVEGDNYYFYGLGFDCAINGTQVQWGGTDMPDQSRGCLFENCIFDEDDSNYALYDKDGRGEEGLVLIDCVMYAKDYCVYVNNQVVSINCTFAATDAAAPALVFIGTSSKASFFDGCVFDGGVEGIDTRSDYVTLVANSTFYNQTTYCLEFNDSKALLVEYNNIYVVADSDADIAVKRSNGSVMYSDYSCAWSVANSPPSSAEAWPEGQGDNSIIVDPLLVNAGSNDFRLQATSPCLHTGISTIGSGTTSMGAWKRKQHPAKVRLDGA